MKLIDDNKILVRVLQTVRIASHLSAQSPRTNSFQSSMSDYAQLEARVVDMRSVDCRSLRHVPEDPGSIPGFGFNLSAWRNARRLVLRPWRPTIHPIWLPRPTLRTCRFKSCRAQQFREWWKTFSPRRVAPVTQVKTIPASRTISSEPYRHSGQTRAVRGGTRPAITGQTQQPNAVQIAIT